MAGSGKAMPGRTSGIRLVAEGVAGQRVLELGHDADLAGPERLDLLLRLALQPADMPDALPGAPRRVEDLAVGLEGAGVDAEERELAHVRIGDGLEDHGGERRLGVGAPA